MTAYSGWRDNADERPTGGDLPCYGRGQDGRLCLKLAGCATACERVGPTEKHAYPGIVRGWQESMRDEIITNADMIGLTKTRALLAIIDAPDVD